MNKLSKLMSVLKENIGKYAVVVDMDGNFWMIETEITEENLEMLADEVTRLLRNSVVYGGTLFICDEKVKDTFMPFTWCRENCKEISLF